MRLTRRIAPFTAALVTSVTLCVAATPAATAQTPAQKTLGTWQTPDHAVVELAPCGDAVCLRVLRLADDAPTRVDAKNPDAALRSRAICGLVIGTGFHPDAVGRLSGGHLYDPKSGHTYQGTIYAEGNTLHLRGYIGISLFGRSETWQRTSPPTHCS